MLSLCVVLSLSLSVYEYGNVRSRVLSLSQWKAFFPLQKTRALTNRATRTTKAEDTSSLQVVFVVYCGYDAVSKGSVYCACKSKQKDGFECEAFFP